MLFWLIVALAAALITLVSLKGWAGAKEWLRMRAEHVSSRVEHHGGLVFETASSRIDAEVDRAERWWPYLEKYPLFWIGLAFGVVMIGLDILFGFSYGGFGFTGLVLAGFLSLADCALPFVALRSDKGVSEWYSLDKSDRTISSWILIIFFTMLSLIVVVGSTSEMTATTTARNTIGTTSYENTLKQIGEYRAEYDRLPDDRSSEALGALAKSTEEAAEREGKRKRCGPKCETLKREAKQYRAREADALRKEELVRLIAESESELNGMGNARTAANPVGETVEGITQGAIPKETTNKYLLTFIGITIVISYTVLWLFIADHLKAAMRKGYIRAASIADEMREAQGLNRKYNVDQDAVALIEGGGGDSDSNGDTIVVNVSAADMRKRFANDATLLEVDELFGTLLEPLDGNELTISDLYKAYRVAILTENPDARYMTQPTMAQKLVVIATHRDDVMITADGVIIGWTLKKDETLHAAE